MFKFRKYIALILILALLCSILPTYTNASQTKQNEKEIITSDDLDEVVQERTASSKTFTDGEGNFVKEIYPEEIHNKVDGKYKTISEELVEKDNKGYIETKTTKLESMFPEKLGEDKPLIYQIGEHKLSFELTYASDGEKQNQPTYTSGSVKEENSITHKSLYPNIDLRHVALNNEVKEDWIMNEYNGINEFHYTIQTDLYGQVEKDGSIGFYENESKEKSIFTLPKPVMVDSNYNETLGDGIRSSDIHYVLNKKSDDSYELVLNASKEWLSSPKRVFPIYIDPSVSIDALGDTFVMSAYPNNNYNKEWDPSQGEYVLKTGYYDSTTGTNYPFIKFSVIGDLKGATIDSAELAAYVTHSYYADTKTDIWVDEVKGQWYADELTWNNKPSSTKITSTSVARDQWAYFDVKNTIQAWVDGTRPNYGFKFHTNGNGKTHWKKITAAESAKKAKLVIGYHYNKMSNPTVNSYSYGEGKTDGYIDVKWGSVYGANSYDLQMYDGKGYQTVYSGSGTNWSSKGKKIFPKSPYSTSSAYRTDSTGVELPVDPSAFYIAKSGTTTTKKDYGFRVVAKFANGDSPVSTAIYKAIPVVQVGIPDIPTVKPYAYPETDTVNNGRGWLDISWKPVTNATGYKILIWNGAKYKEFSVGNVTSVSTKGKKIWPTDADLKNGIKELYPVELDKSTSIGKGTELPIDPSITYGNASNRYSIRIKAISAAGDSASSDVNYGYIPLYAPKNAKLTSNLEDMVNNKSSLTVKWDATPSAKYYEVQISDDKTTKTHQVKGKTSFTSEPNYGASSNYSATVKAYYVDDDNASETEEGKITGKRSLSPPSKKATVSVDPREDLNGLEDYFTYKEHSFGNATASVNVTTGNMAVQFTDESLYTRSDLDYDFERTYNSRSQKDSALGLGWSFIGGESLEVQSNSNVFYYDEDGTMHEFKYNTNQTFTSPKGLNENLVKLNETTYTMTDPSGFIQTFKQNPGTNKSTQFNIASYDDGNQNKILFNRNVKGQLESVEEGNGIKGKEAIQLTYDSNGKIQKVQFANHWTTYEYNEKNQLINTTTKSGSDTTRKIVETFSYNIANQLSSYVDGKNNKTVFSYDKNEFKIFDQQDVGEELSVTNTYSYDLKNNEFTSTTTDDSETTYARDTTNDTFVVNKVINNDETTILFTYDEKYNLLEQIDADKTVNTYKYDENGNVLKEKTSEGTITNQFNEKNQLIKSTSPTGVVTENQYDGSNLVSTKIGKEKTIYEYDSFGRAIKVIYPNNTFDETTYDDDSYLEKTKDAKGNTTATQYTIFGQRAAVTDSEGHVTKYVYDSLYPDVIKSVTDANGHKTNYEYDNNGNLQNVKDALNRTKSYTYNDNDQVTQVKMPGMTFNYEYNLNGELSKEIKPSGIQQTYVFNDDGELEKIQVFDNQKKIQTEFVYEYDDVGNVNAITQGGDTLKTFSYSVENNLLMKLVQGMYTQTYEYDENERLSSSITTYKDSFSVKANTTYKDEDTIEFRTFTIGNDILHKYQINEDKSNNSVIMNVNDELYIQTQQFNNSNLLQQIVYKQQDTIQQQIDYKYTNSGNIKEEKVGNHVSSFEYDANNQLTKETLPNGQTIEYAYDAVGNRLETKTREQTDKFTYNEANQIQTKNEAKYLYDADGNLKQDENFKYEYNVLNQQTRVTNLEGSEVARYEYDDAGLRTKKIIGDITHEYFYNNEVLEIEIIKKDDSIEYYRYYEWDGNTPIGYITKEKDNAGDWKQKAYHYWTNQRGDVVSIRDNEGKEVGSYEYDSYGNVLSVKGETAKANPVRYAGYYYDDETNNYYLQARYYNPINGAFLALDPEPGDVDEPISLSGYNYARNNPVIFSDPTGEYWFVVIRVVTSAGKWIWKGGKWVWKSGKKVVKKYKSNKVKVPSKANSMLKYIKKHHGNTKKGYVGGRKFKNNEGFLPKNTTYREYDIHKKKKGKNRGAERLVIGKNGTAYYTYDHYKTFIKIN
ncbi:hypothetical protein ASG97_22790 [Bacillus sp. Soil745]|nr:hypothetical protein ASG97_22790 [Bacillus sp. Soil745]